jgi:lipoprotein NlpI
MKHRARTHLLVLVFTAAGACRAPAPDASALTESGLAALKSGDTTAAIQAYDKAIALKPDFARAYRLRGDAHKNTGDYDAAIRDYDRAIKLNLENAGIYTDRAFAHQGKGDYDLAIQDFDRALTLNPDHSLALKNRGRTHFYLGHFAEAAADLRRGATLDSTNAYVAIWLHMAVKRMRQDNMQEFASQLAKSDSSRWPTPVARFYQGKLTPDQLLASATNTNAKAQADQRCAAQFYIGESELWNKQPAEAAKRFQVTVASCPKSFTEYDAAHAELGRLGK